MKEAGKVQLVTIEEKIVIVDQWISRLGESETIPEIDRIILKDVLEYCGAYFDALDSTELRTSMKQYSNKDRGDAMRAVWGESYYEDMRSWMNNWALEWGDRTDNSLPYILQTINGEKVRFYNSGLLAFWGELTAFAAGEIQVVLFEEHMNVRLQNGRLKIQDDYQGKNDPRHLKYFMFDDANFAVESEGEVEGKTDIETRSEQGLLAREIKPASVIPDFPIALWEKLRETH